jgi:hypothetical protein
MCYTIDTDGSCLKHPGGAGGYAAVIFVEGEMIEELSGGEAVTTSNRMEITAAIVGRRAVREPSVITLYSDSTSSRLSPSVAASARGRPAVETATMPPCDQSSILGVGVSSDDHRGRTHRKLGADGLVPRPVPWPERGPGRARRRWVTS